MGGPLGPTGCPWQPACQVQGRGKGRWLQRPGDVRPFWQHLGWSLPAGGRLSGLKPLPQAATRHRVGHPRGGIPRTCARAFCTLLHRTYVGGAANGRRGCGTPPVEDGKTAGSKARRARR